MVPVVPAYLDPTTGSIAYQAAISGLLAAAAACRMYWSKIRRLLAGRGGRPAGAAPPRRAEERPAA